ncbi:MAG: SurA N-terminal domain-containing protein [Patescibacteria group bacterium]
MKNALIAVVAVLILGAGGWYYVSSGKFVQPAGGGAPAAADKPVATVNGENIMQSRLASAESQIMAGQGTTTVLTQVQVRAQALDSLIAQALLRQAAQKAGITASSTQVDAQVQANKTQLGGEDAYQQALTAQGMTEEDLRAQISASLIIQTYLIQTLNLSAIAASDAEIKAAYDQVAAQQTGVPPLAQVKDQVKTLVIQQKQQQLIDAQVQKLRAEGEVKVLI